MIQPAARFDGSPSERDVFLHQLALSSTRDCVIIHRPDGSLVFFNDAAPSFHGYSPEAFRRLEPWGWESEVDPRVREVRLRELERSSTGLTYISHFLRPNGQELFVEVDSRWVETTEGPLIVATARDVTERVRAENMLRDMAFHDPLTGLANRALLHDRLAMAVAGATRHGELLGAAYVDLDDFKRVNDEFGHHVGDRVLVALARRIEGVVRTEDTAARLGGDEFLVVLPRLSSPEALDEIGEKLEAVISEPLEVASKRIVMNASIGLALFDAERDDERSLVIEADIAMYQAKRAGGQCIMRAGVDE
jgi:diguanylate cyclase (GGDEF)-like protein/PAS domain S-box-containing protein